ncbi:MAG TPA: FMN-binding glutamate synthase family protein, partial [Mycobacteriales bacterium]
MMRRAVVAVLVVLAAGGVVLAVLVSPWWCFLAVPLVALAVLGLWDLLQRKHSILRNYPVVGHLRFLLERIRPEMQQYFVERNYDGRPYDRDTRSVIYERAKGIAGEQAFGTERDVNAVGYEYLLHSTCPVPQLKEPPRVRIGGPDCTQPYDMALLNVSAMSFGALSANALLALNGGAARGGFAHDTGEGGLTKYHLQPGGDLVWELGSGYFGARTKDGEFDLDLFREKAAHPSVKMVSLKLSQGAKPGIGGVLPGSKVTKEIAAARGVPVGQTVTSPPSHKVFSTPRELVRFIAEMRSLAGGKPAGFKLCVGRRSEFLAICKAMLDEQVTPDFIIVDGAEGGTGAAPLEFEDHVGTPLTEGLIFVHNALVGVGLRDVIKVGKRIAQGADFTNAARAMMMAVGCIQAQKCHTNECPVGVATQDPRRAHALEVGDKTERTYRYQKATVESALKIMSAMGARGPQDLRPSMLMRRQDHVTALSYAELYEWLRP